MAFSKKAASFAKQNLPGWAQDRLRAWANRPGLRARHRFTFKDVPEATPSPFPFAIDKANPLEELGAKYDPSKRKHNYLAYYWLHFRDVRHRVKNVLEIGVQTDRSIRMWEEFFPNATIYGADIDPACKRFEGGRRRILIGDQGDRDFLDQVARTPERPFDIVIDDGSHRVEHQVKTFEFLFPRMSSHGIYVVEDTGLDDPDLVTVGSLQAVIDSVMYRPTGFEPSQWPHLTAFPDEAGWLDRNAIGIAFYRWIVFVMRGRNPQDNPFLVPPTDG